MSDLNSTGRGTGDSSTASGFATLPAHATPHTMTSAMPHKARTADASNFISFMFTPP